MVGMAEAGGRGWVSAAAAAAAVEVAVVFGGDDAERVVCVNCLCFAVETSWRSCKVETRCVCSLVASILKSTRAKRAMV